VIAGNNIFNALLMVISSLILVALLAAAVSISGIFLILGLLNIAVAIYIYTVIPEFLLRFVAWCLANLFYRVRMEHPERIPTEGAAVLVANHVSFVDWLLVASASPRPARFVMSEEYSRLPLIRFLFRDAKVIPITSARRNPEVLSRAYDRIAEELAAGELVCIFPEGAISTDGKLAPFHLGVEKVVERTPVPVVPMALVGLWGSFFSRKDGSAMRYPFRRFWSRIDIRVGEEVAPDHVSAQGLAEIVASLGGWETPPPYSPPEHSS
jgi:1-acyl-sn-glycerol-3-phosphate acyltransferase